MSSSCEIVISAPLPLGDLVAELRLATGEKTHIVLREGRFTGELPGSPVWIKVTAEDPPAASAAQQPGAASEDESEANGVGGIVVAYEALFETGLPVQGPRIHLELVWGLHCHQSATIAPNATYEQNPDRDERFVA